MGMLLGILFSVLSAIAIALLLIGTLYALLGEHETARRIADIGMWFFGGMGVIVSYVVINAIVKYKRSRGRGYEQEEEPAEGA